MSRQVKWTRTNVEEYTSESGIVLRDSETTWAGLVKEGFGLKICGRGFLKARSAMTAVEEAAKSKKQDLPPIHIPARIFC